MKTIAAVLCTVIGAGAAFGCSSPSSPSGTYPTPTPTPTPTPSPSNPTSASISIQDFMYASATVTIAVGGNVTWTNDGPSGHTVASDAGVFDSGTLAAPYLGSAGGVFSRVFSQTGTYPYHCEIHPGMQGSITVAQ